MSASLSHGAAPGSRLRQHERATPHAGIHAHLAALRKQGVEPQRQDRRQVRERFRRRVAGGHQRYPVMRMVFVTLPDAVPLVHVTVTGHDPRVVLPPIFHDQLTDLPAEAVLSRRPAALA